MQLSVASLAEAQQLETATCKVSVYRDELALDWSSLLNGPIKALLQHVPALTLCNDKACAQNCGRFHPAVEEAQVVDGLIIDLWGRQWAKEDGGRAQPSDAQAFHCLIRAPSSLLYCIFNRLRSEVSTQSHVQQAAQGRILDLRGSGCPMSEMGREEPGRGDVGGPHGSLEPLRIPCTCPGMW